MTSIEWTDRTWNPVVGCSVVSPGCTNCYAMKMAARIIAMASERNVGLHYDRTVKDVKGKPVWTGVIKQAPDHILLEPLRRKKPTMYFVNSMGDLFHEDCPDEWIDRVFAVMALAPQHTFQVLTKRAERMRDYLSHKGGDGRQDVRNQLAWVAVPKVMNDWHPDWRFENPDGAYRSKAIAVGTQWPLPNVWLGVSTEDQKRADERIPLLLQTPAAVRFISAEPLLGPIDLNKVPFAIPSEMSEHGEPPILGLDWVIVGGESGHSARPMHPDWARDLRDECAKAGVHFFFKQWGEWAPGECAGFPATRTERVAHFFDNNWDFGKLTPAASVEMHRDDEPDVYWLGKRRAGRKLDGKEHNAFPEVRT